jgi:hypothetical protein
MTFLIPGFQVDLNAKSFSGGMPPGKHPLKVISHDLRQNKQTQGGQFVVRVTVTSGEFSGKTTEIKFNLFNQSEKAVEIAQRQLSCVFLACGFAGGAPDADFLIGKEFDAIFEPQKDNPEYTQAVSFFYSQGPEVGTQSAISHNQNNPSQQQIPNPFGDQQAKQGSANPIQSNPHQPPQPFQFQQSAQQSAQQIPAFMGGPQQQPDAPKFQAPQGMPEWMIKK